MSNEDSASQSDSSNSSSQMSFFQDNIIDTSSPEPSFVRSGTVVRRSGVPFRKDRIESTSTTSSTEDDDIVSAEKYRRETQFRHSLAAISERRSARNSFSNESGKRAFSSLDSPSESPSEYLTDANINECKSMSTSTGPNYLSWIESVNSEYFGGAVINSPVQDVDTKIGEWNNFWLNYSNARLRHLSTEQTFSSDGVEVMADDQSDDRKSVGSTPKDVIEKNYAECVMLTMEEVQETLKCSQRITEILQTAMKRSETDECSNESCYSQQYSGKNSVHEDASSLVITSRERSTSYVEPQSLPRPKQVLKTSQQSSSTSCIDAILNTGVADIFKKVISKKRDVISTSEKEIRATRSSFSGWTSR